MISSKVFLFVVVTVLNFCHIEPPTGPVRLPRSARYHNDTRLQGGVEFGGADVSMRSARMRELQRYTVRLEVVPCCWPLRLKDFRPDPYPGVNMNRSNPAVPLIGPSPRPPLTHPNPRSSLAPPQPCQPWENPKQTSPPSALQIRPDPDAYPNILDSHLEPPHSKSKANITAVTSWRTGLNETLLRQEQFCPNETSPYGFCPKNLTKGIDDGLALHENPKSQPSRMQEENIQLASILRRDKKAIRHLIAGTGGRLIKSKSHHEQLPNNKIAGGKGYFCHHRPQFRARIPVRPSATKRSEPAGIRTALVPLEPFRPVYLPSVETRPSRFADTDTESLLITFPDDQPSSVLYSTIQAILHFSLRSVLSISLVLETAVGLVLVWRASLRHIAMTRKESDEPRTVAMLEGHVVDSLPSEKLCSESCVIVNLSPTNSEESLTDDDWEDPFA